MVLKWHFVIQCHTDPSCEPQLAVVGLWGCFTFFLALLLHHTSSHGVCFTKHTREHHYRQLLQRNALTVQQKGSFKRGLGNVGFSGTTFNGVFFLYIKEGRNSGKLDTHRAQQLFGHPHT